MADYIMEPGDFKKYFYTCVILAAVCFVAAVACVISSGYANVLETSIMGQGSVDMRHHAQNAGDVAMVQNATVVYQARREWGPGAPGLESFTTSFLVAGADASGGYRNQYVVKGSGAGHKVEYRATQITGDFVGSGEIVVSATEAEGETFESLINMDSSRGNATIRGRVQTADGQGRPMTIEELDAVGQFILTQYLQITEPPATNEDWLGFCKGVEEEWNVRQAAGLDGAYHQIEPV
jgi:hypothetical protein